MSDPIAALRARRAEIARALEALEAEEAELATAEAVLLRLAPPSARAKLASLASPPPHAPRAQPRSFAPAEIPPARRRALRQSSQRARVLEILATCNPAWVTIDDIVRIAARRNFKISVNSLRPRLTLMKDDGEIVRDRRLIALRERALEARPGRRSK